MTHLKKTQTGSTVEAEYEPATLTFCHVPPSPVRFYGRGIDWPFAFPSLPGSWSCWISSSRPILRRFRRRQHRPCLGRAGRCWSHRCCSGRCWDHFRRCRQSLSAGKGMQIRPLAVLFWWKHITNCPASLHTRTKVFRNMFKTETLKHFLFAAFQFSPLKLFAHCYIGARQVVSLVPVSRSCTFVLSPIPILPSWCQFRPLPIRDIEPCDPRLLDADKKNLLGRRNRNFVRSESDSMVVWAFAWKRGRVCN